MTATAVSLFAGVGGIDLALERAGFVVTSAVEIDAAARGVLADQFPHTQLHHDVRKVTADELRADGFVPQRGLISAGFPCQDLSVAGRRKGMADGTRSGLFWHVVRLLADLRPRWVLLENVPGLLSACCPCPGDETCRLDPDGGFIRLDRDPCPGELHPVPGGACGPGRCMVEHGGAMGAVTGAVGELGYGFAYRVLDAQHFGVPQRRRRVVLVGCLGDDRRPVEVLLEPEGSGRDHPPSKSEGARVAATLTAGSHRPGVSAPNALTANGVGTCGADDNQGQAGHLIVSPALTASMGSNAGHPGDSGKDEMVLAVTEAQMTVAPLALRGRAEGAELEIGDDGAPAHALRTPGGGASHAMIAVSVTGDHTHALTAEGADASEDGTGRGTPIIAFDPKAGGDSTSSGAFEDGTGITPTMQGSRAPAVAFHMTQDPISGEVVPSMGAKSGGNGVMTDTTVRRLTPRECERLQGYSDDWTATSNGKSQADSPRYKQMGNSVAVPVFEWVLRRVVALDSLVGAA